MDKVNVKRDLLQDGTRIGLAEQINTDLLRRYDSLLSRYYELLDRSNEITDDYISSLKG